MNKESKFKVGDVVKIPAGGPLMTVEYIKPNDPAVIYVGCVWFDCSDKGYGNVQRSEFNQNVLAKM